MNIPDCTIVTCCYDLSKFNDKSLSFDEILQKIDVVLQLPVYLIIFTDYIFFDKIQKIRYNYGFSKITLVIQQHLDELWSYKYINQVKSNREKYWPTRDERTSSESHLVTCNKFDFVLQIIEKNPFNTTKFSWLDSFLGINNKMRICEDYTQDKFLYILNNITDKFHIQILNVNDKKYKLDQNKKEYYNTYKYVVAGGFFTCGKEIGIKILNKLKEIFIKTTELGFGHGEEMLYLDILYEFYNDIEKSYGDYGQIINNFIQIENNFGYIYYNIIKKYLDFSYNKECYNCCKKVINGIENSSNIDYSIYFLILFSQYTSSFYYNQKESISIVNKIYNLCNKNILMNQQFNKNKIFYEQNLKFCNYLKPKVRIIFCIFGCATIEKYKNQILKINQTWGKKAKEKDFELLYFLGEEKTDLLDSKYIYLEGIDNTYSSASQKQNLGLKYIYENYNPDFVFVCGTDTYVNIEKLSLYLNNFNKKENLYIGGHGDKRKIGNDDIYFHSGGAGFILSNKCLEIIYSKLWNSYNNWIDICNKNNIEYLINSCDVQIAYNLKDHIECIKDNESFYGCNYKGFINDIICCPNKIKIDKLISCHNMSLSDFDDFTTILETNNYYSQQEYFYNKYNTLCNTKSDINEHSHTLSFYSSQCESVLQLGVKDIVASWALGYGLLKNNKSKKYLFMNDINECDNTEILEQSKNTELIIEYKWIYDLLLTFDKNFDMTFIDTWHVYGQLKRELNKFSKITNKYIIIHDTTIDEWYGELLKYTKDYKNETGFLVEEINMGLWPAIVEFIRNNPEWKIKELFTNNNGLTILERI